LGKSKSSKLKKEINAHKVGALFQLLLILFAGEWASVEYNIYFKLLVKTVAIKKKIGDPLKSLYLHIY